MVLHLHLVQPVLAVVSTVPHRSTENHQHGSGFHHVWERRSLHPPLIGRSHHRLPDYRPLEKRRAAGVAY